MICTGGIFPAGLLSASTQSRATTLPPQAYGSSVTTASGTFATLAMGHLSDPLNTYWQIFDEPLTSKSFTDETVALAVGTNGGILLGANAATTFEVATRPSVKLTFTPVLENNGKSASSWTPVAPLSKTTTAFSQHNGASVAILGLSSDATLVESPSLGANWRALVTLRAIQQSATFARCEPSAMTAATFDSAGDPVIGVACAKSSVLGLYKLVGGSWHQLSSSTTMSPGMTSVLYLTSNHGTAVGIVCVTSNGSEHLYDIAHGTGTVKSSSLGVVHGPLTIKGMGATPQGGVWITYAGAHNGVTGLLAVSHAGPSTTIPNISSSVATLSVHQDGSVEALSLADGGNAIQVASLETTPTATWRTLKVTHLAIPYGSSG